jgi:transcriptional regulator with XRE-family HTH domain
LVNSKLADFQIIFSKAVERCYMHGMLKSNHPIRLYRIRHQLSGREFCERVAFLDPPALSEIENGRRYPTFTMAGALVRACDGEISFEDLLPPISEEEAQTQRQRFQEASKKGWRVRKRMDAAREETSE